VDTYTVVNIEEEDGFLALGLHFGGLSITDIDGFCIV
jgi:hypothetical protein